MGKFTHEILKLESDVLGELLRAFTFVGEGFGCYHNFEIRSDAKLLSDDQAFDYWRDIQDFDDMQADESADMGRGCSFDIGSEVEKLSVTMCYFWDGDGFLSFTIEDPDTPDSKRTIYNSDCKKNYRWENL